MIIPYDIQSPLYFKGNNVIFSDYVLCTLNGKITEIVTKYDDKNKSIHWYNIKHGSLLHLFRVTENRIYGVHDEVDPFKKYIRKVSEISPRVERCSNCEKEFKDKNTLILVIKIYAFGEINVKNTLYHCQSCSTSDVAWQVYNRGKTNER